MIYVERSESVMMKLLVSDIVLFGFYSWSVTDFFLAGVSMVLIEIKYRLGCVKRFSQSI